MPSEQAARRGLRARAPNRGLSHVPPGFQPAVPTAATRESEHANRLAHDQIARWADRIADGRDEFPTDLAEPDRSALAEAVRLRLLDRLVRLVARAIAARLARRDAPDTQE